MSLSKYEKSISEALADIRRGIPCATAARKHNINRTTLLYRSNGKTKKPEKGPECVLGDETEKILVRWIKCCQKAKFPVTADELKSSVNQLVKKLKLKTPFVNGKPGKKWLQSFCKRHTDISYRTAEYLSQVRASVTEATLQSWFNEVKEYFAENELTEMMQDPTRIFNCDESGFYLNPKGKRVLAGKGDRNVHQKSKNCDKENYTVLVTISAAAKIAPSMVVFALDRIPRDLAESIPSSWGIGRSKNGWMCGETFYEYISNVFNPWLIESNIKKPVVLFLDGHTSHLSLQLSNFCTKENIILVSLYPNTTHICQPLDVSVFKPLKQKWRDITREWRSEHHNEKLKRTDFLKLLDKALSSLTDDTLENGFRHCGLFPFTADVIPTLFSDEKRKKKDKPDQFKCYQKKTTLSCIQNMIGEEKLLGFQNNSYSVEDSSLYQLWKDLSMQSGSDGMDPNINSTGSSVILNTTSVDVTFTPAEFSTPVSSARSLPSSESEIPVMNSELLSGAAEDSGFEPLNSINAANSSVPILNDIPSTSAINPSHSNESYTPDKNTMPSSSVVQPSPSTSIPSPFKKALFWPSETKKSDDKNRKKREHLPAAFTSMKWRKYYQQKKVIKDILLKEKEERKIQREEKKRQKEASKNQMVKKASKKGKKPIVYESELASSFDTSDSDDNSNSDNQDIRTVTKNTSGNYFSEISKDDWAVVSFKVEGTNTDKKFIGRVIGARKGKLIGTFLRSKLTKQFIGYIFQYPQVKDVSSFNFKDIVQKLDPPTKYGRGFLKFNIHANKLT